MINTIPSIPWARVQLNAPKPEAKEHYAGHLNDGSSVQAHSADRFYARHGIVMRAIESAGGKRRLWQALKGGKVIACHPNHNNARFAAWALVTGA